MIERRAKGRDEAMPLVLLLISACAPPPPPVPPPGPTASAAPEPPPDPKVHVAAVLPPARVAIDGELDEWGAPFAPEGSSRLAFAITGDAVLVAAELAGPARDGVWLGLAAPAPAIPDIGDWSRGGGVEPLDCENERDMIDGSLVPNGKKKSPEAAAACRELIARHTKLERTLAARFSKRFRIDREGVRGVGPGGELRAIEGAKAAWKPGDRTTRVEVSLPLLTMPRVTDAPLTWLGAWAAPASSPAPEIEAEKAKVALPAPVSFEPHGALRARALHALQPGYQVDTFYPSLGQSYQPGDPLHVESMRLWGTSVDPVDETLYVKKTSLGDLEVGDVNAFAEFVGVYKKGELVDMFQADPSCWSDFEGSAGCGHAQRRGAVTRNGEIHLFTYYAGASYTFASGMMGEHPGGWLVTAISADGKHRLLPIERIGKLDGWEGHDVTKPLWASFATGKEYANEALDSFGWRGETNDAKGKRVGLEAAYRWDEAHKKYTVTWKHVPLPKVKKR